MSEKVGNGEVFPDQGCHMSGCGYKETISLKLFLKKQMKKLNEVLQPMKYKSSQCLEFFLYAA